MVLSVAGKGKWLDSQHGRLNMVTYFFYVNDACGEPNLIGILPERRKNQIRITPESIMKWGKLVAGSHVDPATIHFTKIEQVNTIPSWNSTWLLFWECPSHFNWKSLTATSISRRGLVGEGVRNGDAGSPFSGTLTICYPLFWAAQERFWSDLHILSRDSGLSSMVLGCSVGNPVWTLMNDI